MAVKHTKEFRDYEIGLIKAALTNPMSRYDLERVLPVKSLYMKLDKMVKAGSLYRALKNDGFKYVVFYSLEPIFNDVPPVVIKDKEVKTVENQSIDSFVTRNGASSIYRLTDFSNPIGNKTRNHIYVSGDTLNNFI